MISHQQMIDELNEIYGRHEGCRALHAKGTLCKATFTATPEAKRLTKAAHMQGDTFEATARVSNGGGNPTVPDGAPDVRGLAVKIYLPDGKRTDLVMQTVARSPTRTPDDFIALVKASQRRLSSAVKLPAFLIRHPETVRALPAVAAGTKPPTSYAAPRYYALHAFKWLDAEGGERHVRYTFVPDGEVQSDKRRGRDYLQGEIRERLMKGPVRFHLEVQIAAPGDNVDDSTASWSGKETVHVGTLEITELETEREQGGDVLVFDPTRVVDGIELTNDPILLYRSEAYSESVKRRSGIPRPANYAEH